MTQDRYLKNEQQVANNLNYLHNKDFLVLIMSKLSTDIGYGCDGWIGVYYSSSQNQEHLFDIANRYFVYGNLTIKQYEYVDILFHEYIQK